MQRVWDDSEASGTDLLVLLAIADAADQDGGNAWPGIDRIAGMCRVSARTVQRSISRLEDLGELIVERNMGGTRDTPSDRRPNRYTVLTGTGEQGFERGDNLSPRQDGDGVTPVAPRGDTGDADGVTELCHPTHPGPVQDPPEPPSPPAGGVALPGGGEVVALDQRQARRVVFQRWVEATGKDPNRTVLTAERRRKIDQALKHYPLDDVLLAVIGWQFSRFHAGENEQGTVYNDLTLLLRNGEKIEMFRDHALRGGRPEGIPKGTQSAADVLRRRRAEREAGRPVEADVIDLPSVELDADGAIVHRAADGHQVARTMPDRIGQPWPEEGHRA